MSGEIILYNELARQDAMAAIEKLGKKFAASGMFGVTKPEQGEVMAMTCLAERMTPVKFSQTYHIVEGRLSMRSDAMLAKYLEFGGKVVWMESTDKSARARWVFGDNDIEIGFTIDDAFRAGLCGKDGARKPKQDNDGNWQKYPDAMLRARCVSKAIRMLAPMINSGIYTPEEVADSDDSPKPAAGRKPFPKRMEAEPKDADARVVDDAPPPPPAATASAAGDAPEGDAEAIAALSAHEDAVNAYLRHLKYISANQTFRDLNGVIRCKAFALPAKVIAQAEKFIEEKEKSNV